VAIQEQVLAAALGICRSRKGWTFRPAEVVAALPDLNAGSVRTHVMSRCCVNAPPNHLHRWPYFRRVARGVYEVLPELRRRRASAAPSDRERGAIRESVAGSRIWVEIRESAGRYVARAGRLPPRFELVTDPRDPVIESYQSHVDRSAIRRNLRLSPEQRLRELQQWIDAMEKIRGVAREKRPRTVR
jgi:hypothetical protein